MKLTEYTIRHPTVSWTFVLLLILGGTWSFTQLGRLEDPAFTIKQAMILISYPGASAQEVEEEVTLPVENVIQELPYLDHITSTSSDGLSQIRVEMKSIYRKQQLAQIWDEMRRKIRDMEDHLPPGTGKPVILDDFGDVYGMFLAVSGQGYSDKDIADYADFLRRELILVPGVGKVVIDGERTEQIYIELSRARLAASGLTTDALKGLLATQNLVSDGGHIRVGSEYIRLSTYAGETDPVTQIGNLLVSNSQGRLVYLKDIARIYRGYADPPTHIYRFNGQSALTLGISFAEGVNVVKVGQAIRHRLAELEAHRPIGMEISTIYDQPAQVAASVNSFLVSLGQAVLIVIAVLLFTMGWRAGVLMSGILLLTILGTFIVMDLYAIELHRISLGALIIALGMLVDNALVVTEGIMVSLKRGYSRLEAATMIVSHTRWPLLGATIIAIAAFAPIGLSPDASGEFTGSLFWVLLISLALSWLLAITLTPFFCYIFFRSPGQPDNSAEIQDPYKGAVYYVYGKVLRACIQHRVLSLGLAMAALATAIWGFTLVKQAFFPASALPMFMVEYRLPEGSDLRAVTEDIQSIEADLRQYPAIEQVTATIGSGAQRFMLTYSPEPARSNYAQLIVQVKRFEQIKPMMQTLRTWFHEHYPQAFVKLKRFEIGPGTDAKIEARLIGPDPATLRELADKVIQAIEAEPLAINIRQDWGERVKQIRPLFDEAKGRRLGITKRDVDEAMAFNTQGQNTGLFRDGSDLLPIITRPPADERSDVSQLEDILIHSPVRQAYVNIGQVTHGFALEWTDPLIKRRDRKRTLSVLADPVDGVTPATLLARIRPAVEAIELPPGYQLEWGGEYEAQQKANRAVFAFVPLGVLVMIILTIILFTSVRQTLVIWLAVPLSLIGVTLGLLVTGAPFSFMALLALISLIGMQLKNGIVLVEEIKRLKEEENTDWYAAIHQAAISRLRPVTMAALTTILGMIPLLGDVFFQPMAVTIMFGLGFATLLTLIVIPVLFAVFYRVPTPE